jgi:predicted ATP-dependent protease
MNMDRIYSKGPFKNRVNFSAQKPIRLTKQHLLKYLGKSKLEPEAIHDDDMVGVINGLYATDRGYGGIIPILVYRALKDNKRFGLELTGKQGKTMKESVGFAWTIAKNCVAESVVKRFYESDPGGLHIHTPDGATPKDGPSAGSAFTTAFISRITGLRIKREVAMTGEINIGGAVSAIGGLEHKLNGAKEAGVKFVFVCKKNIDDVKKIKKANPALFNLINPNNDEDVERVITTFCKKKNSNTGDFKVMIITTIYDIIPYVLIDPEYVEEHYGDEYDTYGVTCDLNKFMIEDPDELIDIDHDGRININVEEVVVHEEDVEDLDYIEDVQDETDTDSEDKEDEDDDLEESQASGETDDNYNSTDDNDTSNDTSEDE